MKNKHFIYLVCAVFVMGSLILLAIRFISSNNINILLRGNDQLLEELTLSNQLRTIDRGLLSVEARIRAAIATNDTSHFEGVDENMELLETSLKNLSSSNNDTMTATYINRLKILAERKKNIKDTLMNQFLTVGNMKDTVYMANPHSRMISNEIVGATSKIYSNRQQLVANLSHKITEYGHKAFIYNNILSISFLLSNGILCLFIIRQFRGKNELIQQLNLSEKTARDAARTKENFLANMSHEIRTPLNAILGFTNLLKKRKLDDRSEDFVHSIHSASENLLTIINDILDLSKIEAGMMRIVKAPFSIREVIHSLETLLSERIREKGLTLSAVVDPSIPDILLGDATRLLQILVNITGNALKFSEKGEIKIAITKNMTEANELMLHFKVSDQGIGIDKDKLSAIFERFNQAEDAINRNYGGTGLGLSIVDNLIQAQNGRIRVESEIGVGTSFYFSLPYTIADRQVAIASTHNVSHPQEEMDANARILVVDDNSMNRSLMENLLTDWGVLFDIVSNGNDALQLLKNKRYNLILLDIQMPGMDGYAVTAQVRSKLKSDIPIIAMTAQAMEGERKKCLEHGMDEYISKPFSEKMLLKIVSRFITSDNLKKKIQPLIYKASNYKLIDLSYMQEISNGNLKFEQKVTLQFINSIPEDLKSLRIAFDQNDSVNMNRIAHHMKTSVAIVGLLPKVERLLDILEFANAENTGLLSIISKLSTICSEAIEEAKKLYDSLN